MTTISAVLPHVGDILEPASNEQARAAYLERQMKEIGSVKFPSHIPSLEDGVSLGPENLPKKNIKFLSKKRDKRKHKWESHRVALEKMKESKEKQHHQQSQEERNAVYAQMLQNLERTRAAVRSSISKASTISDEEH